jgi:ATP-dependent helicase/nuclease subunit A
VSRDATPDLLLVDHEERRRALEDLDASLLVEAAAGSGKTTLLLGRIVSLIRSGRARLSEIAAVTFTEKAAADLKVRLRRELAGAGLDEALRELEIARIGTIHAFAAGLLRERPVEAGVDPGFTVVDPLGARLLLDRTWESWLPEALSDPDVAEPVRQAIEHGLGLERLRDLTFALVEQRDGLAGLPTPEDFPEPPATLNLEARATIKRLTGLARGGAKDPEDRAASAVEALAAWVDQTAALPEQDQVRALLGSVRLPDKPAGLGNKAKWRDRGALEECRAGLAALRERLEAARAIARHNQVVGLARWAAGFVEAYDLAKSRAGCLDFLDLLLRARNLVRDRPDVRRDFQRSIRYLLVDEFQDTDPLQLETVVGLVTDGPPGCLFVVGDPKQSIYRFRRADIETYEGAKAVIARHGAALTVRANFRSTRAILDAVNNVFEGVMVPPPDGPYQPSYVALESSPETEAGAPPVVLALAPDVPPASSAGEAAVQEARMVAAYLAREVERGGRFRYGDVALLFRAMTGVAAYEDALRAAGIPFRTVGGRHYYDRSEVGWTIAALSAIEDPHDAVALVGALRSPFFGVTDEALLRLHAAGGEFSYLRPLPADTAPVLGEAWALLGVLHRERNALPPAAVVERLLARTEVLAAYALEPQGEARVANLLKVLDTARALEATGALTFRGLVRWLRDRGAARYEEEESAVEAEDAVRLMTIHKAKGLEFPVVVVPDLGREAPWRGPVVLADRGSGRLAVNLGRVGDATVTTLDWTDAETREIQRVDAEALRVLYVALTRAERLLVLPVPTRAEGKAFFEYLGVLLESPTDVLTAEDLELREPGRGRAAPAAGAEETLAAWRARHEALVARGRATEVAPRAEDGVGEPSRSARQRAAAAALARAALLEVDLRQPADGPVVAALGARRGARADVVAEATRLLGRALVSPVIDRARRAARLVKDVPVALPAGDAVLEDRLDLVWEEDGGLVAVRVGSALASGATVPGPPDALSSALGRRVGEVLHLDLAGG